MVEVATKTVLPGELRDIKVKKMRDRAMIKGVRVVPADGDGFTADDMRELLKHPRAGGFRAEGPIEWPNDSFTQRRLREGSIKLADEKTATLTEKPAK
jgi:hypothetical protein